MQFTIHILSFRGDKVQKTPIMSYNNNQQVFNTAATNTHSFGGPTHSFPTQQQADSAFYANMQPMQIPAQLPPPLSGPFTNQHFAFDPNMFQSMQNQPMDFQVPTTSTPQPQIYSGMPILMDFNHMPLQPAQAVFPLPPQQFTNMQPNLALYTSATPPLPALYTSATPPPPIFMYPHPVMRQFQPVEVPANMQLLETVHGQLFPVLKNEESARSNASSESGMTSITPPLKIVEEPPARRLSPPRRIPPGFGKKPKSQPPRAKPMPKRSETINYARAAKVRVQPTFRNARPSIRPMRAEKSRVKRETAPPKSLPRTGTHQRRTKKKFGFRSKQNMIDKVYEALSKKYADLGILASSDEVLRGDDTIRLHVKKFKALKRIQEALEAVERDANIVISKVSIPLSMKNQFQKKGFLVYTRVADVSMVAGAKRIFQQFEEFKKCEVAKQVTPESNTAVEPHISIVEEPSLASEEEPAVLVKGSPVARFNVSEAMEVVRAFHVEREGPVEREGHVKTEETEPNYEKLESAEDLFCGSVDAGDLSFDAPATGSPELTPANKLFGEEGEADCGLDDLNLSVLPMMPKMSIGEAGQ